MTEPGSTGQSEPSGKALVEEVPGAPAPREVLTRLHGLPGRVLLESAGGGAGYSLFACDPVLVFRVREGRATLAGESAVTGSGGLDVSGTALDALEVLLGTLRGPPPPAGIPFAGGMIGYLAYEVGDLLEDLPPPPPDDVGMPEAWFGVYDRALLWDHPSGRCRAVATPLPGRSPREARSRLRELVSVVLGAGPVASDSAPWATRGSAARASGPLSPSSKPISSLTESGFKKGVERIRDYIRAGDLFQANLTRRISVVAKGLQGDAFYEKLVGESPAAFAAYLDTGEGEVASISPELFLSLRGDRIETRPIKGTARRGTTPEEDVHRRQWLMASEKDRAENVMIVDLLRNDLSRVSRPGSIAVPELVALETHPTVHHLRSTVVGRLEPGLGPIDLLRATFPGGSITGAPKIRAMEVLRELEPVRRGVYTGTLGILGFHGDLDLSVAIRTAVLRDGWVRYGTGGGITLSSDPDEEWIESRDKAKAFFRALAIEEEP